MTYREKLTKRIEVTGSNLCVGLDPRPDYIDGDLQEFLEEFVTGTMPYTAAYKPNIAYFESMGSDGIRILERILNMIPSDVPVILDCKRGDIGETQRYYARACFETWGVDAVTLNPYLGAETLRPFLEYGDRGIYLLGVTSNPGSEDIQRQMVGDRYVYEIVNDMTGMSDQMGLVLGLTNASDEVLSRIGDVPLLIPGLGAQGGSVEALAAQKRTAPLLINVSRGIMFSEPGKSFAEKAQRYAGEIASVL